MDKILKINDDQKSNKLIGFLVFSVFFHAALLISKTSSISFFDKKNQEDQNVVKLRLVPSTISKLKKQIVQTEQLNNNEKVDTAFLGKKNNKVNRQTRAANTGKFKTAGIGKRDGSLTKQETVKNIKKKKKVVSLKDLGFKSNPLDYSEKEFKKVSSSARKGLANGHKANKGLGQSNDFIEDIPLGDFTKLNTQEFEFYGFYDRIRQKLEQFWGRNIEEQSDKIFKEGRAIASDTNHITALEIEINSVGEIVKVDIKSASGIRELDSAAIDTFNQAGPFPNPPSKMLKGGRAKIKWSFVVNT
jgi:TonB family protein